MRTPSWLPAVCLLWQLSCGDAQSNTPAAPSYVASQGCRLKTFDAWQHFLAASADDPAWVKTCSDQADCEASAGGFAQHVQADVLPVFAECAADLQDTPLLAACTANLRRFAPAWLRQHSSDAYGFEQANADYFAAQVTGETPPGMMDPPQALLDALPLRASVEEAARSHGWPYLTHDSCLGGVRTFIHVSDPDDRFEQWLLFGVDPTQPSLNPQDLVSFIAIQKQTASGVRLDTIRLHFRDYALAQDETWKLDLPVGDEGKCYACHGSGVRQLIPYAGSETTSAPVNGEPDDTAADPAALGSARLAGFNELLASYGLPDWNGTIAADDYGPPLGSELGCTHCHDGRTRGPLTVFTSEGMLYQKVLGQLSMRSFTGTEAVPDLPAMALLRREQTAGESLSKAEGQALAAARAQHQKDYDALVSSRLPSLQAWLLATPCAGSVD